MVSGSRRAMVIATVEAVGPSAHIDPRRPGGPARPGCVHYGGQGFFVLLSNSSIIPHLFGKNLVS
jgi:hypothetical protein